MTRSPSCAAGRDRAGTPYYAYALDSEGRLRGVVSVRQLFAAPSEKTVADVMTKSVVRVSERTDQEDVARLLARHNLVALRRCWNAAGLPRIQPPRDLDEDCRFPLDFVWLDEQLRVAEVLENAPPCHEATCAVYWASREASCVLELNAGTARQQGLVEGRDTPGHQALRVPPGSVRCWNARGTNRTETKAERRRRDTEPEVAGPAAKTTLTVTEVQRFLGKSKRSFYQLRCDTKQEFSAPFLLHGRDHWLMADVLDWIASRRRRDAIPGRTALACDERKDADPPARDRRRRR
jgi:predicted DNA-binding transcriptional regulator AlpA